MSRIVRILAVVMLVGVVVLTPASAQAQYGNTWFISFFSNPDWSGGPSAAYSTTAPLAFNWGYDAPMPGLPVDYFTMRASTDVWMSPGMYTFTLQADDEISLRVNGITYLDARGQGQSGKTLTVQVPISSNSYQRIDVDYREYTQLAYVFVSWNFTAPAPGPMPDPMPNPGNTGAPITGAQSVQTRYGDYTPCIQANNHQKVCFVGDGAWDSPNFGSIEMESKIVQWGNCARDQVMDRQLYVNMPPQSAACSRTEAGWFPR